MILIGSKAAELKGFYPLWRTTDSKDFDIVCQGEEEAKTLTVQCNSVFTLRHDYGGVISLPTKNVDVTIDDGELGYLIGKLSGPKELIQISPAVTLCLQVATPEVVWATLVYTAGSAVAWHEKSFRDLEHYESVATNLTSEHWRLAQLYRLRVNKNQFKYYSQKPLGETT